MTAQGTACNGAGEAPKAEFVAEKVPVAAHEDKAPADREGEDVGGPFVIVNGDSDGLSDRGSDLGKAPDEDSPSEDDEAPASNAASVGGDHGAPAEEAGASAAAPCISSADESDRTPEEPKGGADETKGEPSADFVTAEVLQQETAGGEQGVVDADLASGTDPTVTGAVSDAPALDSVVNDKEVTNEDGAATDVSELVVVDEKASAEQNAENAASESCGHDDTLTKTNVSELVVDKTASAEQNTENAASESCGHADALTKTNVSELVVDEAASAEQNEENAASESCGHDNALTKTESASAAIEPEVHDHVDDNLEEDSPTTKVEPVDQNAGGPGAQLVNGHRYADTKVSDDSSEVAAETQSHIDDSKLEKDSNEVADLVEQGDACGEQDGVDATQTNGHTHFAVSSDPNTVASEFEVHANGMSGKQNDRQEEEAPITEAEVEEVVDAAGTECTGIVEEPVEEGNDVDGHSFAKVSADASGEQEAVVENVEAEASFCIQVEETMENDGEGGSCDDSAAGVASNEEVKLPDAEGMNETVPSVDEMEETIEDISQEQGDGLVNDGETEPSVETNQENNALIEIAQADETTAESDLKADSTVEVNTAAPLLSEKNCDSAAETVDNEQSKAPDVDQPNEIENENDVAEAEAIQEAETEVCDVVPSQAVAPSSASTSHNEPQPTELVDDGSFKLSEPLATELKSCDQAHTEEIRSREISADTIDQLVSGASLEHGPPVAGQAELSSVTEDESQEKPSNSAVDQGESVTLNEDELVLADDAEPSSATCESAGTDELGDISKKDELIDTADESIDTAEDSKFHEDQSEICNASTACDVAENITSESLNTSAKSSDLVETKCLEALEPSSVDTVILAEHKVDEKHAHGEKTKAVEDSSESRGDLDKNDMGDAQVIRQQKVYIIKVPRFAGEDLWEKIQDAHSRLDELTQERDAINIRKQKQKSVCDQYREKFEAARQEEREARAAHGDKKNDLNSVRSVIGKLNQANSIEEIEEMIATKERIMQHETISLKEEKLLIKEINDLKAQRKQLSSNMGSKAEINEAFDQKEQIHERHKTLKKDSDVLFTNLKSLEENTKKIKKSFEDERLALRKLNDEYRAANERRQKAYSDWAELKAEPFKKNKYFFMYKDDRRISGEHVCSGNVHELQLYCNNQVERVMEMWNKDEDFRKQYVEANKVSTLRRLGTHDGRRLGPDEEPPVIPSTSRRPNNPSPSLAVSSPNVPTTIAAPAPAPVSVSVKEDSFPVLPSPDVSKCAKSKASGASVQNEKSTVTVSERDVKETEKEKSRLMEEELGRAKKAEELARIEEKLREEKAAVEKERLRLEQKAKAKEAEERKRRKAEKAQERAEFKARKEAEMKEKKKAKKEKRKGPADSGADGDSNTAALATADTDSNASDNPREVEVPQPAASKRISRPAAAIKQLNRVQPMPAPLRNRGKRKMRQYVLIAAAVLSVLALFVAGNYIPRLKSLHS